VSQQKKKKMMTNNDHHKNKKNVYRWGVIVIPSSIKEEDLNYFDT
jgi:hypothetical protein